MTATVKMLVACDFFNFLIDYRTYHAQYSTVQFSTVQYSTVQYSSVQYSTVQYSTYMNMLYVIYNFHCHIKYALQCSVICLTSIRVNSELWKSNSSSSSHSVVNSFDIQETHLQASPLEWARFDHLDWNPTVPSNIHHNSANLHQKTNLLNHQGFKLTLRGTISSTISTIS